MDIPREADFYEKLDMDFPLNPLPIPCKKQWCEHTLSGWRKIFSAHQILIYKCICSIFLYFKHKIIQALFAFGVQIMEHSKGHQLPADYRFLIPSDNHWLRWVTANWLCAIFCMSRGDQEIGEHSNSSNSGRSRRDKKKKIPAQASRKVVWHVCSIWGLCVYLYSSV